MNHEWYVIDIHDPDDPSGDPVSVNCALIQREEGQYMVFDVDVPGAFAPFRHGDIITASRGPGGVLVFGEVVQRSRGRSMDFNVKMPALTPEKLSELLGDYAGGPSEWDPSPGLAAVLDRIMANGGNWEFLWGSSLRLHLPEGYELSAEETALMEEGRELRITIARMRFNQRNGIRDPENEWQMTFPKRRRKE